jgi:hypothetical protein
MIKPGICINKPRAKSFKQRNFCGVNRFAGNAARNSRDVISLIIQKPASGEKFLKIFYLKITALNTFDVRSSNTTDG